VTGAAFLDRDGVINKSAQEGDYITSWAEFEFLPGVPAALRALRDAGYRLIVVTNQRGIARGVMSQAAVDMIHERMSIALAEVGASVGNRGPPSLPRRLSGSRTSRLRTPSSSVIR
jgi:D-glycero-D-manno-heptose 1,7-bisphosphate phosphatase